MQKNNPKVSVIVPIYNTEKYLERCLKSLISQTLQDIEIICVDDGSPDNSLSILHKYAKLDSRVLVFHKENSGPGPTRNLGLDHAIGKYVMFCDSDDWYEPNMCEEMYNVIECQKTDLVWCDVNVIDIGEKHNRLAGSLEYPRLKFSGKKYLTTQTKLEINCCPINKIFILKKIKENKISFPNTWQMEDASFCYQYFCNSESCFGLAKQLYNYEIHAKSIVASFYQGKFSKHIFDRIYSSEYTINKLKEQKQLDKNIIFVFRILEADIKFLWSFLNFSNKCRAVRLWRNIIDSLPFNELKPSLLNRACFHPTVLSAIKISWRLFKFYDTPFTVGRFSFSKDQNQFSIKFCDFILYQKEKTDDKSVRVFCGVKIWSRHSKDLNMFLEENLKSKLESYKQSILLLHNEINKHNNRKSHVILFDALHGGNFECIDAYSLFLQLNKEGISCSYFVQEKNVLYRRLRWQYPNSVFPVCSPMDLFEQYQIELANATHIMTSFGLGDNKLDCILHALPYCEYVFLEHGIIFLKESAMKYYGPNNYNKIIVASPKTKQVQLQYGSWKEKDMLFSDLPRWKFLKKSKGLTKEIFCFFTFRNSFQGELPDHDFREYNRRLNQFFSNTKLQRILQQQNITLKIAVHHTIEFYQRELHFPENIQVVPMTSISRAIKEADLLITDYSSIFADFMRLNTPIIFYLFDKDVEYYSDVDNQNSHRFLDEKASQLYNVFTTEDDVINKIQYYIQHNFQLEEEYKKINESFFWKDPINLVDYITQNRK